MKKNDQKLTTGTPVSALVNSIIESSGNLIIPTPGSSYLCPAFDCNRSRIMRQLYGSVVLAPAHGTIRSIEFEVDQSGLMN